MTGEMDGRVMQLVRSQQAPIKVMEFVNISAGNIENISVVDSG